MPTEHRLLPSEVLIFWLSALARYSFPLVIILLPWELPDCFWHLFLHLPLLTQRQQSFGDLARPPSAADPLLLPCFIAAALGNSVLKSDALTWTRYPEGKINIFSSNQRTVLCVGKEDVSFDLWTLSWQIPPSRAKFWYQKVCWGCVHSRSSLTTLRFKIYYASAFCLSLGFHFSICRACDILTTSSLHTYLISNKLPIHSASDIYAGLLLYAVSTFPVLTYHSRAGPFPLLYR